jgi:hypothetical protein
MDPFAVRCVSFGVCWENLLNLLKSSAMRQCRDSPRHNTAWQIHWAQAVGQYQPSNMLLKSNITAICTCISARLQHKSIELSLSLAAIFPIQLLCNNDLQTLRKTATLTTPTPSNRAFLEHPNIWQRPMPVAVGSKA